MRRTATAATIALLALIIALAALLLPADGAINKQDCTGRSEVSVCASLPQWQVCCM